MLLVQESDKLLFEEVVQVCDVWLNVGGIIYVVDIIWLEVMDLIIDVLFGIGIVQVLCDLVVGLIEQVNVYFVLVVVVDILLGLLV